MNNFSYFPLQHVCRSAGAILPFYLYAPRVLLVIFVFNLKIMQTITLQPTTIARWKRLRVVRAAASKHHFDFRNVRRWKSYMWVFCLRTKANSIQFRVFFPLRSSHMNAFLLLVHSVTKSKDRGSGTKEPFGQLKLIENLNWKSVESRIRGKWFHFSFEMLIRAYILQFNLINEIVLQKQTELDFIVIVVGSSSHSTFQPFVR